MIEGLDGLLAGSSQPVLFGVELTPGPEAPWLAW
jgi:hypothetical protein